MGFWHHACCQSTAPSSKVKALQFLEQFLEDHKAPPVDRYATGVALFATYARARFGDLKQIAEIFIDGVAPTENEGLGYLEMMSASHKMRSTGNRLEAHLPLIAPLKGLGREMGLQNAFPSSSR